MKKLKKYLKYYLLFVFIIFVIGLFFSISLIKIKGNKSKDFCNKKDKSIINNKNNIQSQKHIDEKELIENYYEQYANKWLLITNSSNNSEKMNCNDGIILNTDYFLNLKNGLFICVEFFNDDKQAVLKKLEEMKFYKKDVYIKNSGDFIENISYSKQQDFEMIPDRIFNNLSKFINKWISVFKSNNVKYNINCDEKKEVIGKYFSELDDSLIYCTDGKAYGAIENILSKQKYSEIVFTGYLTDHSKKTIKKENSDLYFSILLQSQIELNCYLSEIEEESDYVNGILCYFIKLLSIDYKKNKKIDEITVQEYYEYTKDIKKYVLDNSHTLFSISFIINDGECIYEHIWVFNNFGFCVYKDILTRIVKNNYNKNTEKTITNQYLEKIDSTYSIVIEDYNKPREIRKWNGRTFK